MKQSIVQSFSLFSHANLRVFSGRLDACMLDITAAGYRYVSAISPATPASATDQGPPLGHLSLGTTSRPVHVRMYTSKLASALKYYWYY